MGEAQPVPKITGKITYNDRPFTGMIIVNDLAAKLKHFPVKKGKPDEDIELKPNYYTLQFVPSDSPSVSSYPQYKVQIPEGEEVEFEKLDIEQLV